MTDQPDDDLPVDATFVPSPPIVHLPHRTCPACPVDGTRCPVCGGPALAQAMTIPAEDQRALAHNRARYAELAALRMGMPNRYARTRYR